MSRLHRSRQQQDPAAPAWGPRAAPDVPQAPPTGRADRVDTAPALPPRKRRMVFFWVFLAVQIIFLIWLISGIATAGGTPDSCSGLTGDDLQFCKDAGDLGTTIGAGLIVGLWAAVDFVLAVSYAIYRLSRR